MSKVIDINTETGEIIEREMTVEELKQFNEDQENSKKRQIELANINAKKAALLDKLGITEDEAKLLLS
jgi:hypothetical protein